MNSNIFALTLSVIIAISIRYLIVIVYKAFTTKNLNQKFLSISTRKPQEKEI